MKKYLLLLATAFMAISFTSCGGDEPGDDGGGGTSTDVTLNKMDAGIYYDQKLGLGSGLYSVVMSNDKGEKLRLDCFGTVSTNAANAKMTTGDYKMGTVDEHAVRTFVVAKDAAETLGTIFWDKDNTPVLITDGTFNVSITSGKTKIVANFKAGDKDLKVTFNNVLKFENKSTYPPHTKDVIVAKKVWSRYMGKYMTNSTKAGHFLLTLLEQGDLDNKNAHGLQLEGMMPFVENNEKAELAVGTYTIVSEEEYSKLNPFTLVAGNLVEDTTDKTITAQPALEYFTDEKGNYTYGWIISEGTVVVEKNGENYKITANLKGKRADKGSIVGAVAEDVKFSYEGPLDYMQNYADPRSTITKDTDYGTLPVNGSIINIGTMGENKEASQWQCYFFGEGVTGSISGDTLSINGEGDVFCIWLVGPKSTSDLPVGDYPIGEHYYAKIDPTKNVAVPADPYIEAFGGPQNGFYIARFNSDKTVSPTGSMPAKGFVNTTLEGNTYTVHYEIYNRYGNKITGKFQGDKNSMRYIKGSATRSAATFGFEYQYQFKF